MAIMKQSREQRRDEWRAYVQEERNKGCGACGGPLDVTTTPGETDDGGPTWLVEVRCATGACAHPPFRVLQSLDVHGLASEPSLSPEDCQDIYEYSPYAHERNCIWLFRRWGGYGYATDKTGVVNSAMVAG